MKVTHGGEEYLVLTYPLPEPAFHPCLTAAEREIAKLIVRGSSSQEIAAKRGASRHTVANQIRSIYTKLGISSRVELVRTLCSGAKPTEPTD